MNTSKQLNFDPELFGDAVPELPPPRPVVRRWPAMLVGSILGAVLASATILIPAHSLHHEDTPTSLVPADEKRTAAIRPTSLPVSGTLPAPQYSENWCESSDSLCTRILTGNPADALKKVILSIPATPAKQYRVEVHITSIEPEQSE